MAVLISFGIGIVTGCVMIPFMSKLRAYIDKKYGDDMSPEETYSAVESPKADPEQSYVPAEPHMYKSGQVGGIALLQPDNALTLLLPPRSKSPYPKTVQRALSSAWCSKAKRCTSMCRLKWLLDSVLSCNFPRHQTFTQRAPTQHPRTARLARKKAFSALSARR